MQLAFNLCAMVEMFFDEASSFEELGTSLKVLARALLGFALTGGGGGRTLQVELRFSFLGKGGGTVVLEESTTAGDGDLLRNGDLIFFITGGGGGLDVLDMPF